MYTYIQTHTHTPFLVGCTNVLYITCVDKYAHVHSLEHAHHANVRIHRFQMAQAASFVEVP